jgi:hypothetical protein
VAGVADPRQAGVGDESDVSPGGEVFDEFGGAARFVVFVVADERLRDREMAQEISGMARVFAGDDVGALQHLQRAERDVAESPDGRGDEGEHGNLGFRI